MPFHIPTFDHYHHLRAAGSKHFQVSYGNLGFFWIYGLNAGFLPVIVTAAVFTWKTGFPRLFSVKTCPTLPVIG